MKPDTYYRGVPGKKYGIWNCSAKCFQFNIREEPSKVTEKALRVLEQMGFNVHGE